jgi:hypothetical protein
VVDNLKEQEGVHRVGGLGTGRDKPDARSAIRFREFVCALSLVMVAVPGRFVSCVSIGAVKFPEENILAMCPRCVRIWSMLALSLGCFAVTAISPPFLNSPK